MFKFAPTLGVALVAAACATPAVTAAADRVSRPVSSSANVHVRATTTAKVLVAVPNDRPKPSNYLYDAQHPVNAIRRGRPLLLDDFHRPDVGYTLGYVRPVNRIFRYTFDRYNFGGVLPRSYRSETGTFRSTASRNEQAQQQRQEGSGSTPSGSGTTAQQPVPPSSVATVFAGGFEPLDTLDPAVQSDGYALLNLGRNRDARDAFEATLQANPNDASAQFGHAVAVTLLGDLEAGRTAFTEVANAGDLNPPLDAGLRDKLTNAAATLFPDDPTVTTVIERVTGVEL